MPMKNAARMPQSLSAWWVPARTSSGSSGPAINPETTEVSSVPGHPNRRAAKMIGM